jgi:hypothetical protein
MESKLSAFYLSFLFIALGGFLSPSYSWLDFFTLALADLNRNIFY